MRRMLLYVMFGVVVLWVGIACFVWGAPAIGRTFEARCVRVVDGDTVVVSRLGRQVKVRLVGIDCPEARQPFGDAAKWFVHGIVVGKTVIIQGSRRDKYDRLLADVISLDGFNVNRMLVASGLAVWYRKYAPDDRVLELLEASARRHKRGIWSQPDPIPPWQFRQKRERKEKRDDNREV